MLFVRCRRRDQLTMIGWRRLIELRNRADGIELRFDCPCGDVECMVTGRRTLEPSASSAPGGNGRGMQYLRGRPYSMYATAYGVELRQGRPVARRSAGRRR